MSSYNRSYWLFVSNFPGNGEGEGSTGTHRNLEATAAGEEAFHSPAQGQPLGPHSRAWGGVRLLPQHPLEESPLTFSPPRSGGPHSGDLGPSTAAAGEGTAPSPLGESRSFPSRLAKVLFN